MERYMIAHEPSANGTTGTYEELLFHYGTLLDSMATLSEWDYFSFQDLSPFSAQDARDMLQNLSIVNVLHCRSRRCQTLETQFSSWKNLPGCI